MSSAPPRPAAVTFVFLLIVMDVAAMGIVLPVLPKLVESFLEGDTAHAAEVYGVFGTAWGVMQFFCMPVIGALSDRYGRRPVILVSCLGLGLDYFLMALAPNLGWLLAGRIISGITAASISTAFAYIADVTPPERRAQAFGMLGAGFGVGFVIGPALGGILGGVDPRLPFWVAGAIALANAAYGWFVLPESLAPDKRAKAFPWPRANPLGALQLLRRHRELLGLAVVLFLMQLAHVVLPSVMVLYMGYRYGWGEMAVGLVLAGVGACAIVVQGGLIRPAVRRFGERLSLATGLTFGAAGFLIYGMAPTGWLCLVGIPVMSIWGLAGPSAQAIMTRHVGESEQGQLQGAIASIMSIAGVFGPGLFTQTFAAFIGPAAPVALPGAPFLLAMAIMIAALALACRATRGEPPRAPPPS